jgi:isopentenyl-diphosphate delta-isomerase
MSATLVGPEMEIDAVNADDQPVGIVSRRDTFALRVGFRVAHVLLFNSSGELLIQQLASKRPRHPGEWGSSVAAYLFAGESYRDAAERRVREELGIQLPLKYFGKTSMIDEGCRKFIGVFVGLSDGPFAFDHNHINALRFLPVSMIDELDATRSAKFTPTFLDVLRFYEAAA